MRIYLITGAVVIVLGVGSTLAMGGYDDVFELSGWDRDHRSDWYHDATHRDGSRDRHRRNHSDHD